MFQVTNCWPFYRRPCIFTDVVRRVSGGLRCLVSCQGHRCCGNFGKGKQLFLWSGEQLCFPGNHSEKAKTPDCYPAWYSPFLCFSVSSVKWVLLVSQTWCGFTQSIWTLPLQMPIANVSCVVLILFPLFSNMLNTCLMSTPEKMLLLPESPTLI